MKIAMIGQKGIPAIYGGIERHVEDLATELTKKGHKILVYSRKWYSPMVGFYKGIKVIATPTIRTKHLDTIIHTLTSTIHALFQKVDVIHYHGVGPSLLSWIPRIVSPRIKVVSTFHCIDRYHQKWGFVARTMLKLGEIAACIFPHQTIAVSKTIQSYSLNEYQRNSTFVPNGVKIPEKNSDNNLLLRWGLASEKYLLVVTRLVRHKGVHYAIDAWKFVKKQYPNLIKDYKLVIVGGSSFTDDYVEELYAMAEDDNTVMFTGWLSGEPLEQLYANAGLFVHPSENEGLPITVLQAMSHGLPVLVSDIPEHQEVISDRNFWFTNTSISSLANKIVELLRNPDSLKKAGEENKNKVVDAYLWDDIAEKTEKIYCNDESRKQTSSKLKIA